jgi:hypothetical protein
MALVLVVLYGWAGSSQAGNLVVIASNDPLIEAGSVIDGNRPIRIALGASLILVSSIGNVIKLSGPYDGAPDTSVSNSDSRIVDSLSRLITTKASSPSTLAVSRGEPEQRPPERPDIWGIDITYADKYCLRQDQPTMLWWADADSGTVVTVSSVDDGSLSARIRWPRGKRYLAWPKDLTLSDGATYIARFGSEERGQQLVTILMPDVGTDAHRAAWMAENGCTRQALKVLAAMAKEEL